jgi:hypothetical protein
VVGWSSDKEVSQDSFSEDSLIITL